MITTLKVDLEHLQALVTIGVVQGQPRMLRPQQREADAASCPAGRRPPSDTPAADEADAVEDRRHLVTVMQETAYSPPVIGSASISRVLRPLSASAMPRLAATVLRPSRREADTIDQPARGRST